MALIAHAGAESGNGAEAGWFVGTIAASTTQKKTGSYSYRCNPTAGPGYMGPINASASYQISFYLFIATAPSSDAVICSDIQAGYFHLKLTTTREIDLY